MKRHKHISGRILASLAVAALALTGCSETELATHWAKQVTWPGQHQESQGTYKVGDPYRVGSVWYYPHASFDLVETGIASWYGPGFHAQYTANGEVFDQNALTAAHRTLQMPCLVRVTNLGNGRSVVVRVNDRGPFAHGRIIDVSKRAAELLGFIGHGTARVRIQVLGPESRLLADAASRGEDTTRLTYAELQRRVAASSDSRAVSAPVSSRPAPVQLASAEGDASLPESLRTPTITVEDLTAPPPVASRPVEAQPAAVTGQEPPAPPVKPAPAKIEPVVSQEKVRPTGIFVQAGSFSVFENAERLTSRLTTLGPTRISPVTVNGHKFYRVKLGPIASVSEADRVLEKVIILTGDSARVIKN